MIRHKGQTLLNWLQSFAPLMTKYIRAHVLNNALTDDDVKKLWKLHFTKQINMSELHLITSFRRSHLTPQELGRITALTTGVFDIAILTKLLTKLGASLEYYEPDAMVKSYLYQHSHSLGWDKDKLNFRNPKERDSRHKGDSRSAKRKSPNFEIEGRDNKTKRLKANPQKITPGDQCKHAATRARISPTRIKTVDTNKMIGHKSLRRTASAMTGPAIPSSTQKSSQPKVCRVQHEHYD